MSFTGGRIIAAFDASFHGRKILDYHNNHTSVTRDAVIDKFVPRKISPCAIGRAGATVCMRRETVVKIARGLRGGAVHGSEHEARYDDVEITKIMRDIMREMQCGDEKCVLNKARDKQLLSPVEVFTEGEIAFKHYGPTDITLISDSVIRNQLYAWMFVFPSFWAYNFNMRDYASASMRNWDVANTPDTLATINWHSMLSGDVPIPIDRDVPAIRELIAKKQKIVRCGACIINSDVYTGPGKHWMALFVDARDSSPSPNWSIEFFNSAATSPEPEWIEWQVKTHDELAKFNPKAHIEVKNVCRVWHQHSKTECGVYSLFYIWMRLNNVPAEYFMNNVVPDQIIFEFRQHLFNDKDVGSEFNFEQYADKVKIKWESEAHHVPTPKF